jgi:redox-sensitive bicupin YhaK (pirin superfamily)
MIYRKSEHGYFDHDWLKTYHHFSFGDYYNENKMHYGHLRVLNDDVILPHQGFPMHPHRDMEIMSYVVSGGLSHKDSMGHEKTVYRGEVQYMSAGSGVMHSEYNHEAVPTRLLQIWFYPDEKGGEPAYGDHRFPWEERINQWLQVVGEKAPVKMKQDVNVYVTYLEKGHALDFEVASNRQIYLVNIEGETLVDDVKLEEGDALTSYDSLRIKGENSHIMVLEMKRLRP